MLRQDFVVKDATVEQITLNIADMDRINIVSCTLGVLL